MGSFTDNLLKLTEFPFSYSLITLLIFISTGHPLLDLSSDQLQAEVGAKIGALLIIMGFVATTLSITDPVGALQKRILLGSLSSEDDLDKIMDKMDEPIISRKILHAPREVTRPLYGALYEDEEDPYELKNMNIFGRNALKSLHTYPAAVVCLFKNYTWYFKIWRPGFDLSEISDNFEIPDNTILHAIVLSLKRTTVRTPWMQREIDKITSMGYFVVVILVFIVAIFTVPGFVDKFVVTLQAGNESAMNHIKAALAAAEAKDKQTAIVEINFALRALNQIEESILWARGIIIGFSIGALIVISSKIYKHSSHLRSYANITFLYLFAKESIKIETKNFTKSLEDIEKYLDNNDWPLAKLSVLRLMDDYNDLALSEWRKKFERKEFEQISEKEKVKDYRELGIY